MNDFLESVGLSPINLPKYNTDPEFSPNQSPSQHTSTPLLTPLPSHSPLPKTPLTRTDANTPLEQHHNIQHTQDTPEQLNNTIIPRQHSQPRCIHTSRDDSPNTSQSLESSYSRSPMSPRSQSLDLHLHSSEEHSCTGSYTQEGSTSESEAEPKIPANQQAMKKNKKKKKGNRNRTQHTYELRQNADQN